MHLSCVLDSRFPASARTGPVSPRTSSAGMIRLRRTEGLAGVFHLHFDQRKGVQRGKAPLPRVWGCLPRYPISPQEWGVKGVEAGL